MSTPVSLGGFVIHGNSAATLGRCLDSLQAVCDGVIAVDSESTDGSAAIVREHGVRSIIHPWRGYGAAREAAVAALPATDYVFFLDSDEWLEAKSRAAIQRWKLESPALPHYTVRRRDWADIDGRRFRFRAETRARIIRRDCATWTAAMIVHEAMPHRTAKPVGAAVEHAFADNIPAVRRKQLDYAFLWAVRAAGEGKRPKSAAGRRLLHLVRNAVIKGALWRGGWVGVRLAWAVAAYHVAKYDYLRALAAGRYPRALEAWRDGRYAALFDMVRRGVHRRSNETQP